ncbi:MAG: cysteine desulfuration protein SufE, partial [Oryzihumus sp.]
MSTDTDRAALPTALAEIAEDFSSVPVRDRLELLLEFSDGLPDLPERYVGHPE